MSIGFGVLPTAFLTFHVSRYLQPLSEAVMPLAWHGNDNGLGNAGARDRPFRMTGPWFRSRLQVPSIIVRAVG